MNQNPLAQKSSNAQNNYQNKYPQQQQKINLTLIWDASTKFQQSWIDYLKSYDILIQPDETETLFFVELNCEKHLLVSDFLELYDLNKLNYQWFKIYDSKFREMISDLQQEIQNKKLSWYDVKFENLCFTINQKQVKLIALQPKNYYQNEISFTAQTDSFLSTLDLKKGKQSTKSLLELIQQAQKFIKPEIEIPPQIAQRYKMELSLLQRLNMKLNWRNAPDNQLNQLSSTLKNIFKYIEQVNGQVFTKYISQFLVEQTFEVLQCQENYLKILSLQAPLTNEFENSLINQGNIYNEIQTIKQIINNQLRKAQEIYNTTQNLEDAEISNLFHSIKNTQQRPQQENKKNQQRQPQFFVTQLLTPLTQIFFQEISNYFWLFDDIGLGKIEKETQTAIQKFLQKEESFFLDNSKDKQAQTIVINQMISQLQQKDEFMVISLLLNQKLDQIMELFKKYVLSVHFKNQFSLIKSTMEKLKNDIQSEKQIFLEKLKQDLQLQNDILVLVFSKCQKTFVEIDLEIAKQQPNDNFETKSKEKLYSLMNQLCDGRQNQQILVLQENLKYELKKQIQSQQDFEFLQNCIQGNDLKQFTNPFLCKNETIIFTTEYRNFLKKISSCWPYYFTLSTQISEVSPIQSDPKIDITEIIGIIRKDILSTGFRNFVLANQEKAFNFQFFSYQLQTKITQFIAEKLQIQLVEKIAKQKEQLEKEQQILKQQQINQKMTDYQYLYSGSYVPFEIIEETIANSLNSETEENTQLLKYQQISEDLQQREKDDLLQFRTLYQQKIDNWEKSQEKLLSFSYLKGSDPLDWDQEKIADEIDRARFNFFLPERKQLRLKSAITKIHNAFNNECQEILNTPPELKEFDLDSQNKIPYDQAVEVEVNERLFKISDEFLEQVYQFYEQQIQKHLQWLLE